MLKKDILLSHVLNKTCESRVVEQFKVWKEKSIVRLSFFFLRNWKKKKKRKADLGGIRAKLFYFE